MLLARGGEVRWVNNRAPNSFKKRGEKKKSSGGMDDGGAVTVTRVTSAATGDGRRRGAQSPRIPLKSAGNCAAALEVLCFLSLGASAGRIQAGSGAFSQTLGRD